MCASKLVYSHDDDAEIPHKILDVIFLYVSLIYFPFIFQLWLCLNVSVYMCGCCVLKRHHNGYNSARFKFECRRLFFLFTINIKAGFMADLFHMF